jgi:hypothetical protein
MGVPHQRRISNRAGDSRLINNREHRGEGAGRGSRVMWLMILIGMGLAAGFVFALRSQINAYKIAQAEELLKKKLDDYSSQQQFLSLDKQMALSASESERAAKGNGLNYLKLDRETSQREVSVQRVVSRSPVRDPQVDQNRRLGARLIADSRNGSDSIKGPVNSSSQAKAPKVEKAVKTVKIGMAVNVMKVVKLNAAKRDSAGNRVRPNMKKGQR